MSIHRIARFLPITFLLMLIVCGDGGEQGTDSQEPQKDSQETHTEKAFTIEVVEAFDACRSLEETVCEDEVCQPAPVSLMLIPYELVTIVGRWMGEDVDISDAVAIVEADSESSQAALTFPLEELEITLDLSTTIAGLEEGLCTPITPIPEKDQSCPNGEICIWAEVRWATETARAATSGCVTDMGWSHPECGPLVNRFERINLVFDEGNGTPDQLELTKREVEREELMKAGGY